MSRDRRRYVNNARPQSTAPEQSPRPPRPPAGFSPRTVGVVVRERGFVPRAEQLDAPPTGADARRTRSSVPRRGPSRRRGSPPRYTRSRALTGRRALRGRHRPRATPVSGRAESRWARRVPAGRRRRSPPFCHAALGRSCGRGDDARLGHSGKGAPVRGRGQSGDDGDEFRRLDRLGDVRVEARGERPQPVFLGRVGRQGHRRDDARGQ